MLLRWSGIHYHLTVLGRHRGEASWRWSLLQIRLLVVRRSTVSQKQFIIIMQQIFTFKLKSGNFKNISPWALRYIECIYHVQRNFIAFELRPKSRHLIFHKNNETRIKESLVANIYSPLHANVSFLYSLKTLENQNFPDIFRCRNWTLVWNGLMSCLCFTFHYLLLHDGGHHHIETNSFIIYLNEWTDFYMIGTSVMKELKTMQLLTIVIKFLLPYSWWPAYYFFAVNEKR